CPETLPPGDGVGHAGLEWAGFARPLAHGHSDGLNQRPDRPPGRRPVRNARMSRGQD
ncbi:MAG: hypothetical protein AVDCRST_MAG08-1646, partial [uncultured Acetobacteraceae bacterium]